MTRKIFQVRGYQGVIDKDSRVNRVPFDFRQNDKRAKDGPRSTKRA